MPNAFTDADLGAPYNRASSPKQSPCYRVFLISPLIMIWHSPFSIIKYDEA